MDDPKPRLARFIIGFFLICVVALPMVVKLALSYGVGGGAVEIILENKEDWHQIENRDDWRSADTFDYNSGVVFKSYQELPPSFPGGAVAGRTLEKYYSRRQYPGSPPFIPHGVQKESKGMNCLACHGKGGFVASAGRYAPKTPHPEQVSCRQCHVRLATRKLFKENDWMSVPPPKLGQSQLPGSPPSIPHQLQMRENCIACHVGPGAVAEIRIDHSARGYCRQCHLPIITTGLFERKFGND